jgi:hypothetical protein
MVTVLIAIPASVRRHLAAISKRTGITRNELVRRALAEWLASHSRRKRKEGS